jgi:outer membrane cobalamin receptor
LHDVAHARLHRTHQQRDVNLATGQDDSDCGPGQPERGGKRQGVTGHGARTDDHQDFVRVTIQQFGSGWEIVRSADFAADAGNQLPCAGGWLAKYRHGSLLDSGLLLLLLRLE